MATSDQAVIYAKDKNFRARVNMYVAKAAAAVMTEVNTTPGHSERVTFANKVFINDYSLDQYVATVITNSTVLAAINDTSDNNGVSDSDLEFTVNSFFSAFSGVAT